MTNSTLFVIPARGGSKGVINKNKRLLNGKPLITYTIEETLKITTKDHICLSTDDQEIIEIGTQLGLSIPFVRPAYLSQDDSSSRDVLLHAVDFYKSKGIQYETVVMLQPTSPLRKSQDIEGALNVFSDQIDAVVSVTQTKSNPYFVLFEENEQGRLEKSKKGFFQRRQDCPEVFELNGAIYVININSLRKSEITLMDHLVKYEMPKERSIDIDTELDFRIASLVINEN